MAKRKIVKSDIRYHVIFGVRKGKKLLTKEDLYDIISSGKTYFERYGVKVTDSDVIEEGSAVYLEITCSTDVSLSNVVFNIKRESFPVLYKKKRIKDLLTGEKAIWTRDFVVSIKGKYTAVELYHELLKEENDQSK